MLAAWVILTGLTLLAVSLGLQASLLGVRAEIEGFPTEVTGLIMSGYLVGLLAGVALIPKLLPRLGHGALFAVLTSLATCALLAQASFAHPALWGAMRVLTGFGYGGLLMIAERWLSEQAPGATRARILPAYLALGHAGLAVGQALLLLSDPAEFQLFSLTAVITSLALVPILAGARRTPKDTPPLHIGLWPLFRGSPLASLTALGAGLVFGAVFWMGAFYGSLVGFSDQQVCLLLGSFLAGGLLLQWPIVRLATWFDRRSVIAGAGFLATLAGFAAVFVSFYSTPGFFAVIALIGGFSQPLFTLALGHANDRFNGEEACAVGGSVTLLFLVGTGAGAVAAGFAMSPRFVGHNGLFLFITFVHLLVGTYALYRMARRDGILRTEQGRSPPLGPSASPVAVGTAAQALRLAS